MIKRLYKSTDTLLYFKPGSSEKLLLSQRVCSCADLV